MRRRTKLALHAAAAVTVLVVAGTGCGPTESEGATGMTDEEYVAHVAALTVAVGEGLRGDAAIARAAELGGGTCTRAQMEEFAEELRLDPERWAALERLVDARIHELTR